ncbi:ribosomal protein L7Ae-like protein [Caldalkalibacillus thermarum TA2.A1]|uniref:RNA-binding protein CathTA2_2539 n=1 Tax=Caldalkalibacillus thermarum (strain TA2.A1) TaxID=986075 RepID=F5L9N4_CALTT|nr:50S ribosomal protein L7ae-like protein [Caldalkalibacillus thermarum]EGL82021.1 ribosomal protein L7Ae-like protein [Caldalkalibacillus thermarum TA2.A1]QZT34415.1 50S ribosomal protein L7ae-like protein [Caldalkalibacillus thermarum TA2.A1]
MSYEKVKQAQKVKVGLKQTLKAVERGEAKEVIIAQDADPQLISRIKAACENHEVPVSYVDSMRKLGKVCGIDVGASSVVIEK